MWTFEYITVRHQGSSSQFSIDRIAWFCKLKVTKELGKNALYDLSMGMAYGLGRGDNEVRKSTARK